MKIDFSVTNQCEILEPQWQASLFKKTYELAQKQPTLMRLSGPFVGAASGLLRIARQIAYVAELILKGAYHLPSNCGFGASKILISAPINLIVLPVTILYAIFKATIITLGMLFDPIHHSRETWFDYDPTEAAAQAAREKQAKDNLDRTLLQAAHAKIQQNPNDIPSLKYLAKAFGEGISVIKDPDMAMHFYSRAANAGDTDSMVILGNDFASKNDHITAARYYLKAANGGNADGMTFLGSYYQIAGKDQEGYAWFEKAASKGHEMAMAHVGRCLVMGHGVTKDWKKAETWLRQAAKQNNSMAKIYLAVILRKDESRKQEWFDLWKTFKGKDMQTYQDADFAVYQAAKV